MDIRPILNYPIGNLALLTTFNKNSLVDSINEVRALALAGGGGGGTPGGATTQVQFNNSGAFAGDSTFTWDNTNKVLNIPRTIISSSAIISEVNPSIVWVGDSITAGSNLVTPSLRHSTRISTALGFTEDNRAVGGSVITAAPVVTKTATMKILVIAFGTNDLGAVSAAQYLTNVTTYINSAIAAGWSASQIYVQSTGGYQTFQTDATLRSYNTSAQTAATNTGANYIDAYTPIFTGLPYGTQASMSLDGIHPNDGLGTLAMYSVIVGQLRNTYNITNQAIISTGLSDLSQIKLKSFTLNTSPAYLLGISSNGTVSPVLGLPDQTRALGQMLLGGSTIQRDALLPASYDTTIDNVVKYGSKTWSVFGTNSQAYIQIFGSVGGTGTTAFVNVFSGGKFSFFTSLGVAGAQNDAFDILNNGITQHNYGMYIPVGASYIEQALTQGSANHGRLQLFDNSGNMYYRNSYSAGTMNVFMSSGVDGTEVQYWKMFPTGRQAFQQGGTFTDDGVNMIQVKGSIKSTAPITVSSGYTVAGLPAGTIGMTAYVTDALTPTYNGTLVGGGSVKVPVFYNGTAWISA